VGLDRDELFDAVANYDVMTTGRVQYYAGLRWNWRHRALGDQ
jgi:hypothetical protein